MDIVTWSSPRRLRLATSEGFMSNTVERFLSEECFIDQSSDVATSASSVYRSYLLFAHENNFKPVTTWEFSKVAEENGINRNRSQFLGLTLRQDRGCDYPSHDLYDGKKIKCPSCNHEKISVRDAAHGINRGQQISLKTKALFRAIREFVVAAREFIAGEF